MGRWRPPVPPSSPYITAEGLAMLQQELKDIWKKRSVVVKALSAAAAEGDRSENAEYIYRKKELGGLDRRIRFLQKRIPTLNVVDSQNMTSNKDRIFFGAWVTLESEEEREVTYRIVGADETNAKTGFISIDSPMAKALLGKQVDDEIVVRVGDMDTRYEVLAISYTAPG